MKKILMLIIMAAMLCMSLLGCSKSAAATEPTRAGNLPEQTRETVRELSDEWKERMAQVEGLYHCDDLDCEIDNPKD